MGNILSAALEVQAFILSLPASVEPEVDKVLNRLGRISVDSRSNFALHFAGFLGAHLGFYRAALSGEARARAQGGGWRYKKVVVNAANFLGGVWGETAYKDGSDKSISFSRAR